ncbi:MAG: hypothetical protein NTZ93_04830 [Candidatus Beckwithbacteria bacterium]|nr:hypothetical protein [Candidatus Beckwithbacteria bacterium]
MPKGNSVSGDVFGELLETVKQTVKAGAKVVQPEKISATKTHQQKTDDSEEKTRAEQIRRLAEVDKKQSRQAYEEIQNEIKMIRKRQAATPRKYVVAATGYDKEQHENPESFWDKMKKKKETMKKKLPLTSKQGMGTGEITRGVSG